MKQEEAGRCLGIGEDEEPVKVLIDTIDVRIGVTFQSGHKMEHGDDHKEETCGAEKKPVAVVSPGIAWTS